MNNGTTLDAPIRFEGVIFITDDEGHLAKVSVVFGYGDIPTKSSIQDLIQQALDAGEENTGKKWHIVPASEFLSMAAREETGARCHVSGPDKYEMWPIS